MADAPTDRPSRLRRLVGFLDRINPVLLTVTFVLLLFAGVSAIQGQARVTRVVDCLGSYTGAYDAAQTPRVKAANQLDAAEISNDADAVAWVGAVQDLFAGKDPLGRHLRAANKELLHSLRVVRRARIHVIDTRREHPYPEPCTVD